MAARTTLHEYEEKGLEPSVKEKFFSNVTSFYEVVVQKMVKKFPWDDQIIRDLVVLDPSKREDIEYTNIVKFGEKYTPEVDPEFLKDEFQEFQLLEDQFIPLVDEENRLDSVWGDIIRPFVCLYENCFKKYTRAAHLKRHENVTHAKVLQNDQDQQCDKNVINDTNSVETGEGNLSQDITLLKFESSNTQISTEQSTSSTSSCATESSCNDEVNINTQSQKNNNYMCNVSNCKHSFKFKEGLEKHIKNYHDLRKFECNICGLQFRKHQHLKVHSFEHTNIKPFNVSRVFDGNDYPENRVSRVKDLELDMVSEDEE
ncbi:Zinc finger protein ZXDC [Nymphon striatum]|nr:Zinc finger protein ZXDC [Nymphon striatum]